MMAAASVVGGALAYYPIGKLSDRMDRRRVIVAVAGCGIVIGGLIVVLPAGLPAEWLILLFGLFGLAQHPIYGLCIAHANDHAGGQSFTQTTSELLLTYGLGTIAGPVAAAVTMRALGDASLFLFTSCVYGTLILFTLWRMRTRLAPPAEQKTDVAPLAMVPTTPEAHALDPATGPLRRNSRPDERRGGAARPRPFRPRQAMPPGIRRSRRCTGTSSRGSHRCRTSSPRARCRIPSCRRRAPPRSR